MAVTLDVSLHTVTQKDDDLDVIVVDHAISRYTQIGGGKFDRLIADELQRRFEEKNHIKLNTLPDLERSIVRFILEDQAERKKIELTDVIDRSLDAGIEEIPDNLSVEIEIPFLYDNKGLFTTITKKDLQSLVAPLLGWELSMNDVDGFGQIDYTKADNVIYPIIDVLYKAKIRTGEIPRVDAIILNGGMTRMHAVRDRLYKFFGKPLLRVLDPDLSVSRGASIYHNLLHRGLHPKQILAESIGILAQGDVIQHVATAGTVLPFHMEYPDLFVIPNDRATIIDMPIYRGERKTPEHPNVRLATPRFRLPRPFPMDTPIAVIVDIDESKMVQFTAKVVDNQISVSVSESGEAVIDPTEVSASISGNEDHLKTTEKKGPHQHPSKIKTDLPPVI